MSLQKKPGTPGKKGLLPRDTSQSSQMDWSGSAKSHYWESNLQEDSHGGREPGLPARTSKDRALKVWPTEWGHFQAGWYLGR